MQGGKKVCVNSLFLRPLSPKKAVLDSKRARPHKVFVSEFFRFLFLPAILKNEKQDIAQVTYYISYKINAYGNYK